MLAIVTEMGLSTHAAKKIIKQAKSDIEKYCDDL